MNVEIFVEWLKRQRISVVKTSSSYWYEAGPRIYQAIPFHWVIEPTDEELSIFLHKTNAIALRYSSSVNSPRGQISYHVVYDKPNYTLGGLDRRSRQNVRSGLKNCQIKMIPLGRLAEEGWFLEKDTASRQGSRVMINKEKWRKRYLAARDLPGFEAWAALCEDHVVASLLTFQMGDCCQMISQQCHQDYLKARVNNALTFVVTQNMIRRPAITSIFYGLHSLDAPGRVDEFKFRMGYIAKPVRQKVVFHPWLESFANGFIHKTLIRLVRIDPCNRRFRKAEGMLRFYLQGKRQLSGQEWPECLLDRKSELCEKEKVTVVCGKGAV